MSTLSGTTLQNAISNRSFVETYCQGDCLKGGFASEPVALDPHGNWKLTVTHRVAGVELHVGVVIDVPSRAIVITVFRS